MISTLNEVMNKEINAIDLMIKESKNKYDKVGDNLYIKDIDVPDYWISAVLETNTGTYGYYEISRLETQAHSNDLHL